MRLRKLPLLLCIALLFCAAVSGCASETPAEHAANVAAAQEMAAAPVRGNLPEYSLSPAQLAKAQHLSSVRVILHFGYALWNIAVFVILLWFGIVAWIRDRAMAGGAGHRARGQRIRAFVIECLIFTVLYNLLSAILDLPLSVYSHILSVANGLSVQGWSSWLGDWAKGVGLGLLGGFLLYALVMAIIRRFPRTWWLVCWGVAAPLMVLILYVTPLVVDPLFNTFEPLQKTNPALVEQLQKVVARANMNIPPDRMFLMRASAKVTTMNAYVTGFGASKRVVVWDTSLQKGTPDEVIFIFGHESGHYVLGHVLQDMLMIFFGLFAALYVSYRFMHWSLARFDSTWRIPSQSDWGALVVLFFAFTLLTTLIEPLTNAISRHEEHAADVYGQEAIHGIVANPQKTAQGAFQVLGENSLEEPNTPPFVEFWMESHPATGRRAAFAAHYDPWSPGTNPKYFKK